MPLSSIEQIVIVVAGVVVTLLLGWALLYWIDQEWRKLDKLHFDDTRRSDNRATDNIGERPPDQDSSGF